MWSANPCMQEAENIMPLLHNPFSYESVVARTQIPTLPHQKPDFYRELLETFKVLSITVLTSVSGQIGGEA